MRFKLSRRNFMKGAAGGVALSAMGAPFGAQQAYAAGLADRGAAHRRTFGDGAGAHPRRLQGEVWRQGGLRQGRHLPGHADRAAVRLKRLRLLGDDRRTPAGGYRDQQDRADPDVRAEELGDIRDTFTKPNRTNGSGRRRSSAKSGRTTSRPHLWMVPTVYNYDFDRLPSGPRLRRGSQHLDRHLRRQVQGQVAASTSIR